MARKWSGFVAQNLATKEEWQMLEACEAQARRTDFGPEFREKAHDCRSSLKGRALPGVTKEK